MLNKTLLPVSIFIALILTIISCSVASKNKRGRDVDPTFDKLQWFIGTWKGYENGQPFYESWRRINDTLIANYEIKLDNNDTTITESSSFRLIKQEIILGDPNAVYWKVDSIANDYVRLKNDTLRSNKIIRWKHSPDDHWLTLNREGTIRYDMIRMPSLDKAITKKLKINKLND